jgi:hypothetical protein
MDGACSIAALSASVLSSDFPSFDARSGGLVSLVFCDERESVPLERDRDGSDPCAGDELCGCVLGRLGSATASAE